MKNGDQSAFPIRPNREMVEDMKHNFDAFNGINPIGLTKREYFAVMAFQALCTNSSYSEVNYTTIAKEAVVASCELLKQLEQ